LDPGSGFCLLPDNEPDVQAELNEEARNGELEAVNGVVFAICHIWFLWRM